MKKIISLILILAMFTVAMVSCKKDEPTPPAQETRYTITAEEWAATCALTNFTLDIVSTTTGTMDGETVTSTSTTLVKSTATTAYTEYVSQGTSPYDEPTGEENYYVFENGILYTLRMKGTEVDKVRAEEQSEMNGLATYVDLASVTFTDLTYNAETKSYNWTLTEGAATMSYSCFFENGTLVKIVASMSVVTDEYTREVSVVATITGVGTTTVTAPDFERPTE